VVSINLIAQAARREDLANPDMLIEIADWQSPDARAVDMEEAAAPGRSAIARSHRARRPQRDRPVRMTRRRVRPCVIQRMRWDEMHGHI
jgi:hypothetical protein